MDLLSLTLTLLFWLTLLWVVATEVEVEVLLTVETSLKFRLVLSDVDVLVEVFADIRHRARIDVLVDVGGGRGWSD